MPRQPDTAAYLAEVLTDAGAPADMITRARQGYYHDYRSPLATPCIQLVADLTHAGLTTLAERARRGDFDATRQEADAWARSPEGQQVFRDLIGGRCPDHPVRPAELPTIGEQDRQPWVRGGAYSTLQRATSANATGER